VTIALIALVALVVGGWLVRDLTGDEGQQSRPPASAPARSGLPVRPMSSLPPQAAQTWTLILRGGPFPSSRDGVVFENRERRLPGEPSGYYHEYTVPTPGSDDRGARRLITGAGRELYYTGDHYQTFVAVDPAH
jgi:guanyl-specific ribonuclease Sa